MSGISCTASASGSVLFTYIIYICILHRDYKRIEAACTFFYNLYVYVYIMSLGNCRVSRSRLKSRGRA